LTLSVGFVVDDAIVMLENIVRYTEQGLPVREAAFKGSAEIGFTIMSMTLSLVGTLAVMYLAGFSLNNLSIMALTIATGFVVDDAIVMIENITRYI